MFRTLLIANRGEIACRIIRTARRLGLRTIAVYSAADAEALHVAEADDAYCLGPAPARESYLAIPNILEAARRAGAEAVHPGYGFLSENADFAAACEAAGLVFVGPPPAVIRAMGEKAAAKALMEQAGVLVVPGYHGAAQDEKRLAAAARRLGFPLLIKASAGGGGRGMRIVEDAEGLTPALASARREAESAFGNGRLILEKYLVDPRHVEVQIFADRQGNVVHLFERDCSIQRRHQKVIEEAPAPDLDPSLRRALAEAAVTAARAVAYVGAGTVEFVVAGGAFHFIEMNTRLQVEHPVTEMITGLDLVEWQLRIAAGEALPLDQAALHSTGHAVEARLYAEDPARDFLPATGSLRQFRLPPAAEGLRIETGVREGDEVTPYYDPLLAKLVAWGEDRATAIRRLAAALAATRVAGLAGNRDFLLRLLDHPDFVAGRVDTGFIARHRAALLPSPTPAPLAALAAACLAVLGEAAAAAERQAARAGDPHSPWRRRDGWRLVGTAAQSFRFRDRETERLVRVVFGSDRCRIESEEESAEIRWVTTATGELAFDLDGRRCRASVARQGDGLTVTLDDAAWPLIYLERPLPSGGDGEVAGRLAAPMPGKVLAVLVEAGAAVKRGQLLMVLEAMKMEHAIAAPGDGVVAAVHYAVGDFVEEGALLLTLAAAPAGGS